MLIKQILFLILLFSVTTCTAQSHEFNWNDTSFNAGDFRKITFYWECEGTCSSRPCYKDCDTATYPRTKCNSELMCLNKRTYDSLFTFLKKNPNLKIEMKFYRALDGSEKFKTMVNKRSAQQCAYVMAGQGADTSRIVFSWLGKFSGAPKQLGPNVKGDSAVGPQPNEQKSGKGSYGYPGCVTVTIMETKK